MLEEKILVCITPQSNSKVLIDKGLEIAKDCNGILHILYVELGDNIFSTPDTPDLLEKLFDYGARLGGTVHCLSSNDVMKTIKNFVHQEKITKAVFGAPPVSLRDELKNNIFDIRSEFETFMPYLEIIVIEREAKAV